MLSKTKNHQKKQQLRKSQTRQKTTQLQRKKKWLKFSTVENTEEDKTSSDNVTSFNLDVSDNLYIMTPPPTESRPKHSNYRL